MNEAYDILASLIDLSKKEDGDTDYGCCRRHLSEALDNSGINELARLCEIRTQLPKHRKVTLLVECLLKFDIDGNLLSTSDVIVSR